MDSFFQRIAEARDPERLYPVRSNGQYGFYAGRLADGEMQALIGQVADRALLLLVFTNRGYLYDIQRSKLPRFNVPPGESSPCHDEAVFHAFLHQEYSFTPALVRVRQFLVSDDECGFWVGPLPWHYDRFLTDQ